MKDPCWEGYEMKGMKKGKDGKPVPNCVSSSGKKSDTKKPETKKTETKKAEPKKTETKNKK